MAELHEEAHPDVVGAAIPLRIVFVAANCIEGEPVNLGAAAKINALIRAMLRLGFEVHYVDSSHWSPRWERTVHGRQSSVGDCDVTLWRPFMVPNRKIGKVLNVLAMGAFFEKLQELQPSLVWVYNSYAFEGALAARFSSLGVPVVLELEDLPLSRRRGWNPKPYWDQKHLSSLLSSASLVTFVNEGLMRRYQGRTRRSMLLPSVLSDGLASMARARRFALPRFRVGYFGGLSHEKGAGVMLDALPSLPEPWDMVATGAGELAPAFASAAQAQPGRFEFHGTVPQSELHRLMATCDVIVNPHQSIEAMQDGVFPFKVCESVACGALLLSTALPPIGVPLDEAVMFFDGSASGMHAALRGAREFDTRHVSGIERLRQHVLDNYSESAIAHRLGIVLGELTGAKAGTAAAAAAARVNCPAWRPER